MTTTDTPTKSGLRAAAAIVLLLIVTASVLPILVLIVRVALTHALGTVLWVYLSCALVTACVTALYSLSVWWQASRRTGGGFELRLNVAIAKSRMKLYQRIGLWIAIVSEMVSHALSWPVSLLFWIWRRQQKLHLDRAPIRPRRIRSIVLFYMLSTNARALLMLALVAIVYAGIAVAGPANDQLGLIFLIFVGYANATLLTFATIQGGLTRQLKQQPYSPRWQLAAMLLCIGGVLVLSIAGARHVEDIRRASTLWSVLKTLPQRPDGGELLSWEWWKALDALVTISSILFSSVLVQCMLRVYSLKRDDSDWAALADVQLGAGDVESARASLSNVKSLTSASLLLKAKVACSLGNLAEGHKQLDSYVDLMTSDWPRRIDDRDRAWLVTATQIASAFPDNAIHHAFDRVLSQRPVRSIAYMAIAESLFLFGRMNRGEILQALSAPTAPRDTYLSICLVQVLMKRYREASEGLARARSEPRDAEPVEQLVTSLLSLLIKGRDTMDLLRAAVVGWCETELEDVHRLVRAGVDDGDVLGVIVCANWLQSVVPLVTALAPESAPSIKSALLTAHTFCKQFAMCAGIDVIFPALQEEAFDMIAS